MRFHFPPDSPLHLFTDDEVEAMFAASTRRTVAMDEVIVTEGEPGDSMFFLLEGYAGARLDSGAMARSYGPGSYFGELSFINPGHHRSATIVATTDAQLQVIDQTSVQTLLVTHPRAIFTLLHRACRFLVDAERNLVSDLRRRNKELRDTVRKLELTRDRLTVEETSSRTDPLTGLLNRRGFEADLPGFMQQAQAQGSGLALLAMDLDQFKPLNDTLGHAAGDQLLRDVGQILRQGVRDGDLACRLGGDEFVLLLAEVDDASARARAEALCAAIGAVEQQGLRVTSTMGGALFQPGENPETFVQRADAALYAAKRAGRNRVEWAN